MRQTFGMYNVREIFRGTDKTAGRYFESGIVPSSNQSSNNFCTKISTRLASNFPAYRAVRTCTLCHASRKQIVTDQFSEAEPPVSSFRVFKCNCNFDQRCARGPFRYSFFHWLHILERNKTHTSMFPGTFQDDSDCLTNGPILSVLSSAKKTSRKRRESSGKGCCCWRKLDEYRTTRSEQKQNCYCVAMSDWSMALTCELECTLKVIQYHRII
jgi:hypothetical protein